VRFVRFVNKVDKVCYSSAALLGGHIIHFSDVYNRNYPGTGVSTTRSQEPHIGLAYSTLIGAVASYVNTAKTAFLPVFERRGGPQSEWPKRNCLPGCCQGRQQNPPLRLLLFSLGYPSQALGYTLLTGSCPRVQTWSNWIELGCHPAVRQQL